ncbi:hypothetical protein FH972_024504 [Carpinus fangiana]|uniref:Uncharacterized protein n=1 Tax=Carpinus fangiana TaxID=176857 RepID=A0A5N6KYL2_9ROSI|nr:hypothetical protein FH972_024504 [Carpinus fangiana]
MVEYRERKARQDAEWKREEEEKAAKERARKEKEREKDIEAAALEELIAEGKQLAARALKGEPVDAHTYSGSRASGRDRGEKKESAMEAIMRQEKMERERRTSGMSDSSYDRRRDSVSSRDHSRDKDKYDRYEPGKHSGSGRDRERERDDSRHRDNRGDRSERARDRGERDFERGERKYDRYEPEARRSAAKDRDHDDKRDRSDKPSDKPFTKEDLRPTEIDRYVPSTSRRSHNENSRAKVYDRAMLDVVEGAGGSDRKESTRESKEKLETGEVEEGRTPGSPTPQPATTRPAVLPRSNSTDEQSSHTLTSHVQSIGNQPNTEPSRPPPPQRPEPKRMPPPPRPPGYVPRQRPPPLPSRDSQQSVPRRGSEDSVTSTVSTRSSLSLPSTRTTNTSRSAVITSQEFLLSLHTHTQQHRCRANYATPKTHPSNPSPSDSKAGPSSSPSSKSPSVTSVTSDHTKGYTEYSTAPTCNPPSISLRSGAGQVHSTDTLRTFIRPEQEHRSYADNTITTKALSGHSDHERRCWLSATNPPLLSPRSCRSASI